jgi:hypothetical protein
MSSRLDAPPAVAVEVDEELAAELAGAEAAPGEGHEGHAEHDDEHLPIRKALRERMVRLEGMEPAMKLFLGAVVAQLLVGALLLALRNVSMPSIIGDATSPTDYSDLPDPVVVVAVLGFCTAWALVLAGVYRAGWLLRLLAGAAFAWAFWECRGTFAGETPWGAGGAGACLILVLLLGIVTYWPERRFRRLRRASPGGEAPADEPTVSTPLRRLRLAMPFVLFVLIAGACGIAWWAAVHADKLAHIGHADVNSNAVGFTTTFSFLLSNHQYVLIPLLVLAGSEIGDWSDFVSRRVVRFVRRISRAWMLATVTAIVSVLMILDGIKVSRSGDGGGLWPEAALGAVLVGSVLLVAAVAKPTGTWSPKVPFLAVAFVAVTDTVAGFVVLDHVSDSDPLAGLKIYGVSALVWTIVGAATLVVLALRRGKLAAKWVNAGVFVVLVGATETLQALPALGTVVHPLGLNLENGSILGLEGVIGVLAVVALLLVAVAAVGRRLQAWETPITLMLVLLLGLEVLYRVDHVFGRATSVTGNLAIAAAVIMVVAISWEFLSSGESITNDDTPRFSRATRLYVYSGYVLLVAVSVLYYSDLHVHGSHNLIESQFDSEEWVREGILFLGVPLVLTLAIARLQRWRLGRAAAACDLPPGTLRLPATEEPGAEDVATDDAEGTRMELELSDGQAAVLHDLLTSAAGELHTEIAGTDNAEYRAGLQERLDILDTIRAALGPLTPPASPAGAG